MLDQRNSPKLLIGITGTIIALIMIILAYQWFGSTSSEPLPAHELDLVTKAPVQDTVTTEIVSETLPSEASAETTTLIDDTVLKQEVSSNATLAKEELAKLEDIQNQLKQQETLLNEQHQDADQLLALKEEQIKILEAQLEKSQ